MDFAVCALITNDDGQILAVSRKNDPNAFGLPGGKLDPGETLPQAIIRELKEETGLTFSDVIPIFMAMCGPGKDGRSFYTVTFTGTVSGSISTNEAGVVSWVSRKTLLDGPFADYNRKLFASLDKDGNPDVSGTLLHSV